jgi:hypothetical protein
MIAAPSITPKDSARVTHCRNAKGKLELVAAIIKASDELPDATAYEHYLFGLHETALTERLKILESEQCLDPNRGSRPKRCL